MSRFALTAGVIAVWLIGVWAMWRGWRARVARTALPPLPRAPEVAGADIVEPLVGLYLGATFSDSWLDRVAADRLGEQCNGWLRVLPSGVVLRRPGYDDLFVPVDALESARTETAHAGRVIGSGGVIVIAWRHGRHLLEIGFRGDDRSRHAAIVAAVSGLVPETTVMDRHMSQYTLKPSAPSIRESQ